MAFSLEEAMTLSERPRPEETLPQKREFTFEEAMGFGDVPPREPEERSPDEPGYISRSLQSLTAGVARLNAGIIRMPGFAASAAYNVSAAPQNLLARMTGWNIGARPPEWMADNPLAQYYERASDAWSYNQKTYPEDSLISLIQKGEYGKAGDYLVNAVAENAPYSLTAVAGTMAGVPQAHLLTFLGSVEGAHTYAEAREKELEEFDAMSVALVNGTLEAVWERAGTFGLLNWGERLFKDVGQQTGKTILKNVLKFTLGSVVGEGNEEFWTSVTQDISSKIYGLEDIEWNDIPLRAVEAGIIGAASGGTITAPGGISRGLQANRARQAEQARIEALKKRVAEYAEVREVARQEEALIAKAPETPDTIEVLRQAEESLAEEILSPDVAAQLDAAGIDVTQVESALEAYQEAVEAGQAPADAIRQVLSERGIELPQEAVKALEGLVEAIPESTPTEATAEKKAWPPFPELSQTTLFASSEEAGARQASPGQPLEGAGTQPPAAPEAPGPTSQSNLFRRAYPYQESIGGTTISVNTLAQELALEDAKRFRRNPSDPAFLEERAKAYHDEAHDFVYQAARGKALGLTPEQIAEARDQGSERLFKMYLMKYGEPPPGESTPKWVIEAQKQAKKQSEQPAASQEASSPQTEATPLSLKQYTKRFGDNRPKSVVKAEYEDLVLLGKKGIQPNFTREQILKEADSLQRKFQKNNPDKPVPSLKSLEGRAQEILQRKFDAASPRLIVVQKGLKSAIRDVTGQTLRQKEAPTVTEFQALRESLRAQARAATQAARMTKKEIQDAQEGLIEILEKSDMDPADRSRFLRKVKNIQTQEQLAAALPEVESRIEGLIEKSAKRKSLDAIRSELRTVKPRKVSGRLVGQYTPMVQEALTRMRAADRLTVEAAQTKLDANLAAHASGNLLIPDPVTALENKVLNAVANRENLTSRELGDILQTIRALKLAGKERRLVKQLNEMATLEENRAIAKDIIGSRPSDQIKRTVQDNADDTKMGFYNSIISSFIGWMDMMNVLSVKDKTTGTHKSALNKMADVSVEETAKKKGRRLAERKLIRMWEKSYGKMTPWQITKRWAEDAEQKSLGTFTNARGEKIEIFMSKAEARKRWMEFRDPTLTDTIFGENGMAWTHAMRQAVEKSLAEADVNFAQAQMEFYQRYYDGFNEVYSDINGINLPQNKNYSPIRRVVQEREALENELLGELTHRRSITPSAGKARVKNLRGLQQLNDIDVYQRHVEQVEHYKAFARKIRTLNGIFNDAAVREAIEAKVGKKFLRKIDKYIEDFTRGGIDRSHDSAVLNTLKNNYTVSVLAGKLAISVKQVVSFPAFSDSIPVKDFMAGLADLAIDPKKKIKILASSEVMRARGFQITPELQEAVNSKEWTAFQLNPNLRNLLLTFTKWGDRGAIFLGGWPVYRYHRHVLGKSHSEAIREFEIALSSSQQSSDLSQASQWQRGNSWQRLFTVFLSAPNQYFRKELMATHDMLAGRISKKQWGKIMMIYHVVLPAMFQWAADGMKFKPEEQARAVILGSLNGIFIVGHILNAIATSVVGWVSGEKMKHFPSSTIIDSLVRHGMDVLRSIKLDELDDLETILNVLKESGELAGFIKGLPVQQAINLSEGVAEMFDAVDADDFKRAFKRVAGWSKYIVDQDDEGGGTSVAF